MGSGLAAAALDAVFLDGDDPAALARFFQKWSAAWQRQNAELEKIRRRSASAAAANLKRLGPVQLFGPPSSTYDQITNRHSVGRYKRRPQEIARQLEALACERYTVSFKAKDGTDKPPVQSMTLSAAELIQKNGRLGQLNSRGYNVHIAPAARTINGKTMHEPYLFVDNLTPVELGRLRDAGLHLAATVSHDKKAFQGWIRLDNKLLTRDEMALAGALMQRRYGVKASGSGHLAGLTNKNAKSKNGRSPFVRLFTRKEEGEDPHQVAPGSQFIMTKTRHILAAAEAERKHKLAQNQAEPSSSYRP